LGTGRGTIFNLIYFLKEPELEPRFLKKNKMCFLKEVTRNGSQLVVLVRVPNYGITVIEFDFQIQN